MVLLVCTACVPNIRMNELTSQAQKPKIVMRQRLLTESYPTQGNVHTKHLDQITERPRCRNLVQIE